MITDNLELSAISFQQLVLRSLQGLMDSKLGDSSQQQIPRFARNDKVTNDDKVMLRAES